jgi:hypothetical protein
VYNGFGNPVTTTGYYVRNGTPKVGAKTFYYYEVYTPTQVIQAPIGSTPITLSPNPTTGTITLHHPAGKGRLQVAITNTLGQVIHSETMNPHSRSTDITLSGHTAPGIYSIIVRSDTDAIIYKGTFLKQ